MVRWRGIIRSLIPVVMLFFVLPLLVIYATFSWFGFTTDSFLVIFILFQCYIITLQVEIGLRQTAVFEAEYEPALRPKVSHKTIGDHVWAEIYLENVGKYPAYNALVGLVDKTRNRPVEDRVRREPKTLSEEESVFVFSRRLSEYRNMHIQMNVLYGDVLKRMGELHFMKFPGSEEFMLQLPIQRHGILLRYLDDLRLTYVAIKWSKILRESKK